MKISNVVTVVDAHTEGQPMRIVKIGFPTIRGRTIREKYSSMLPEFLPEMDLDTFVNVVALEIEE